MYIKLPTNPHEMNNTVLLLAFGHLSHAFGISWLCFLAGWAENWAKLCATANFCNVTLAPIDAWWPNSCEKWLEPSNSKKIKF